MSFRKSSIWALAFSGVSAISLLGACSGKTTGAAPIALADLPAAYAHAICDNIQGCCSQANFQYDDAACVRVAQKELQDELTGFGGTYDANAAGDCVAAARGQAATCSTTDDSSINDACRRVFSGAKKIGESCDQTLSDCALSAEGPVVCESWYSGNTRAGTQCVLVRTAQAGDACNVASSNGAVPPSTQGDCTTKTSPYYCDSATSTCQPRRAQGAACQETNECASGLACVNKQCATPPALNEKCDDSFGCATGLYCDFTQRKCIAQKKAGSGCSLSDGDSCLNGRCSSSVCSAGDIASASTCAGTDQSSSSGGSSSGGSSSGGSSNGGSSSGGSSSGG